uniref:Calpain catalytic domain-containing protein n=1 Tax=Elaeophora elaphi TaxID=1147741 RepID=A0A158Q8T4_9BILA
MLSSILTCCMPEHDRSGEHNMKCYKFKGDQIGNIIGGFISGGHGSGSGSHGGGGGVNVGDIAGIIGGLAGPGSKGQKLTGLISGIGGLIGKKEGHYRDGGPNVNPNNLSGGMTDVVSGLVGHLAHRYLNVDPTTGRIIGAIAGNLIFNLGGKDNKLGTVGKVILDNIVSGKFKRKVDPYVPPKPTRRLYPPVPDRRANEALDFYAERDHCLAERKLFEDPQFPADDKSLFFSRRPPKEIEWRRPGEICDNPQLLYEGQSRFDVVQGELGDCWLLAAAANLTLKDELFYRVVPPDQSFTENYAGIFHFQFWHYGTWVDVVIDDRLPTSTSGELLYMHSRDNNEFWSALLEKAYAKLHGSYEALKGGTTSEALEDFTGGLTEFFDLTQPPKHLMEMMMRGFEMGSLFGCSIEADPHEWEARMRNGLVKGHAYSITGMKMVNGPRGNIPLLRIRNPWGNEQEWNGAWSDNSKEWTYISQQQRNEMGLVFAHDGEFWMSFNDFVRYFEKMEICNLGPEVMDEVYQMTGVQSSQNAWATYTHSGAWVANETAGGCRNYIQTFTMNPQYHIKVTDSDPYDDDNLCTVIIAVLQKYRRELKHMGVENLAIGFALYDVGNYNGRLTREYFQQHKSCARSAAFINLREITGRFRIPPGNYVIVPSTFEPNEEAEFMLRVYTNGKSVGIFSVPVVFIDVIGYPASITGSSMEPTLHGSDNRWWKRDIVWLSRFGLHRPEIGQIYTPPNDPYKRHIKRITAVDGDIIRPKRGPSFLEIPTGCYWMESDNPNNHSDSRLYGPASLITIS